MAKYRITKRTSKVYSTVTKYTSKEYFTLEKKLYGGQKLFGQTNMMTVTNS